MVPSAPVAEYGDAIWHVGDDSFRHHILAGLGDISFDAGSRL